MMSCNPTATMPPEACNSHAAIQNIAFLDPGGELLGAFYEAGINAATQFLTSEGRGPDNGVPPISPAMRRATLDCTIQNNYWGCCMADDLSSGVSWQCPSLDAWCANINKCCVKAPCASTQPKCTPAVNNNSYPCDKTVSLQYQAQLPTKLGTKYLNLLRQYNATIINAMTAYLRKGPTPSPQPGGYYQCDPSQGCNVCAACCNPFISDGPACESCWAEKCGPPLPAATITESIACAIQNNYKSCCWDASTCTNDSWCANLNNCSLN